MLTHRSARSRVTLAASLPAPPKIWRETRPAFEAKHEDQRPTAKRPVGLRRGAAAAVISGASRPERIAGDHAALKAVIPADF